MGCILLRVVWKSKGCVLDKLFLNSTNCSWLSQLTGLVEDTANVIICQILLGHIGIFVPYDEPNNFAIASTFDGKKRCK